MLVVFRHVQVSTGFAVLCCAIVNVILLISRVSAADLCVWKKMSYSLWCFTQSRKRTASQSNSFPKRQWRRLCHEPRANLVWEDSSASFRARVTSQTRVMARKMASLSTVRCHGYLYLFFFLNLHHVSPASITSNSSNATLCRVQHFRVCLHPLQATNFTLADNMHRDETYVHIFSKRRDCQ